MKRTLATGIVALSLGLGVGAAYAVDAATDEPSTPGSTLGSTPSPTSATPASATLGAIVPGAFEPVRADMTVAEAVATGFIEPDPDRNAVCEGDFYRWTGAGTDGLDIITSDDRVASLGMRTDALATEDGLTVGSTYADVESTYGDRLIHVTSDYGQPGVLVEDHERWLGFLFGEVTPDTLKPGSTVTFIEVSEGDRPGLLRDGC